MSVEHLVCQPPGDPALIPGRYVPPHRRRGDLDASTTEQWSAPSMGFEYGQSCHEPRPYGEAPHASDPRQGHYPQYPQDDRAPSWGGRGGGRSGQFGRDNFSGSRWDDSAGLRGRRGGGWGGSGGGGGHNRTSETGTGWDVRDGRRYAREIEGEIFAKREEKSTGINFDSYENIPVDVSESGDKSCIEPIKDFREAEGIHPLLEANVIRVNYLKPTPVQKHSIPVISRGRDLMACAQTGSGKTAAFLFPIITQMLNKGPPSTLPMTLNRTKPPAYPVALVLSPTRELAMQIFEESRKFAFNSGIRTVVLYGGNEVRTQCMELDRGCDICVATPGRLLDLMERSRVSVRQIQFLVLDEADRMLDMGFHPQIQSIVTERDMPDFRTGRQTVMFSATFPNEIQNLASRFLHKYVFLTVGRVGSTNDFIKQNVIYADEDQKKKILLKLVRETNGKCLVFVETKKKADFTERFLQDSGLMAISIHGDRSQQEREEALRLFRQDKRPILVATDVAARGLDISNIMHVINFDLPTNIDDYVHRIGRTGRAGNKGTATSLVNDSNRTVLRHLLGILHEANQEIPSWFNSLVQSCSSAHTRGGFGRGGRGGRGGRFAARDIRQDPNKSSYGGSGGFDQSASPWRDRGVTDTSHGPWRPSGGNSSSRRGGRETDPGEDGW